MKDKKTDRYDSSKIQVLPGLEGVRRRPAMYIGDVGKRGLHHLIFELVDNSIDEALAGFCTEIEVILHDDGSCTVRDNGRGIPVDPHPQLKKPGVEIVMTTLHAGGKFDGKVYVISGGLHGVGASVVCALSEYLKVWVRKNRAVWYQEFSKGYKVSELEKIGDTEETGTEIRFKPDKKIFKKTDFEYDLVRERLMELAFLIEGTKIVLRDERTGKEDIFNFEGGLVSFVSYLDEARNALHKPFYLKDEKDGVIVEIAMEYNDGYLENILSFVNTINTHEGGTHVSGFKTALTRSLNDFGRRNNHFKNGFSLNGEDVREGLTAVIHVKLRNPQFEGQTKTKLGNSQVKGIVESIFYEKFYRFLEENSRDAEKILQKAILSAKSREAARKARELVRRKSFLESDSLPGKLADCISRNPEESELFIVEGESAGGSAKQARRREFQAILPLKGKILNVEKASLEKIVSNDEVKALFQAIGTGFGEDECDPSKTRYHKIIIMTDADIDGSHIRTLLLTLFYRYLKPLINIGYIYIAQPPLYRIQKGKNIYYVYTEEELDDKLRSLGDRGVIVQRFKGLGEMNPQQLWETTMDPEKRILKRVTLEDAAQADRLFSVLMGDKVEPRRRFIEENAKKVQVLDV